MLKNAKYLSLLFLLGLLLFTQQANAISEQSIKTLDDQVLFAMGPDDDELDQALADHYPEWANFTQSVQWSSEPAKVGEIVSEASFDEKFALNPAVTLTTLGTSLDWQIPPDGDLFAQIFKDFSVRFCV